MVSFDRLVKAYERGQKRQELKNKVKEMEVNYSNLKEAFEEYETDVDINKNTINEILKEVKRI